MTVDPQQLLDDGYIILRGVIPEDRLEPLRNSFEKMVEQQKALWVKERRPEDPPGGQWEMARQPRLIFDTLVDEDTADTIEFCLHENTMGVSRQIMRAEAAGNTGFMFMCNPTTDRGPANWHRDIHPIDQAPLSGLQMDLLNNAPGYVQWNIPLYDDDVLWVVPKSHRRVNTEEENRCLTEDAHKPLPGSIPVNLKAGDGVVYTNTILHWGSNYSARLRRTIHLGYRSFGGPIYPYVNRYYRDHSFTECLSTDAQAIFRDHKQRYDREADVIEATFRAILGSDETAFMDGLATLHPGETGRIVCLILLSKLIYKMKAGTHPVRPGYGSDISYDEDLKPRFTAQELDDLRERFAALDRKIQSEKEVYVPGFQSGPMHYYFNEMPEDFGVEDFIRAGIKR